MSPVLDARERLLRELAVEIRGLVERGDMNAVDARTVGRRILADNAVDLYRL